MPDSKHTLLNEHHEVVLEVRVTQSFVIVTHPPLDTYTTPPTHWDWREFVTRVEQGMKDSDEP